MCDLLFIKPATLDSALAVKICFNLVDSRNDLVVGDQVKKLIRFKIGDADRPDPVCAAFS